MKPVDPELMAAAAEPSGSLGPVWSGPARDLAVGAEGLASEEGRRRAFRRALAAGHFTQFTAYSDPVLASRIVDWQLGELTADGLDLAFLPPSVAESALVRRETLVKCGRRTLSPDFLRYLAYARVLQKHSVLTRSRPRVLEIGGGYGGMARVLKLLRPDATIVLADLPSSLIYAHMFLCAEFPDARVVVAKQGDGPDVGEGADFVFVPVARADCLRGMRVDLAMNIWSFGEIANERNRQWFELLQGGMSVEWLFVVNSFLKRVGPRSEGELPFGEWLTLLDAMWRVADFDIGPRIHRCPYVLSFPSGVSILARRGASADELDGERAKAQVAFDALASADWVSSLGPEMEARRFMEASHHVGPWPLASGTEGPVFRLWQQVRLNGDRRALRLLLGFLRILRGNGGEAFRFKDEFFWREMLDPGEAARERAAFFRNEPSVVLEFGVQAACDLAAVLRRGGDERNAESLYRRILAVLPGHAESMFQLGALAEARHDAPQASKWYSKAYALAPDNPHYRERALRVGAARGLLAAVN